MLLTELSNNFISRSKQRPFDFTLSL